jgi:hypothetical protein
LQSMSFIIKDEGQFSLKKCSNRPFLTQEA